MRTIDHIDQLPSLVGSEVAVSPWLTVDQPLIDAFAAATGDRQWIHVDTERAKQESPYESTIAHGFLTLSLLSGLSRQAVEIAGDFRMRINYGLNRVRFTGPVRSGDRIRARMALQAFEEISGGYQITWGVTMEVESSSKPALIADWLIRLYN